ncbi:MAG: ArnT family glycosyltransferase [Anaerolineae bacterium]
MTRQREIVLAALLLCLNFGLQVTSAAGKAVTYDEHSYIAAGYAYVKLGDQHIITGAPLLLNALSALPLLALPDVRLPVDDPSWAGSDFHPISEHFLWDVNDNADQIVFLARVPLMLLELLLLVFCYRWARELFGVWGGLLSLALAALDPNLIANGRIAATDLGSAVLLFIATYWLWRLLRRPSWSHLLAAGVTLGLAQATKFSALLFLPIYGLLFALRALSPHPFVLARGLFGGAVRHGGSWGLSLRGRSLPHGHSVRAISEDDRWGLRGRSVRRHQERAPRNDKDEGRFARNDEGLAVFDGGESGFWGRVGKLAVTGTLLLLLAGLTLWAVYGFDVGPVEGLTAWPVPAPGHVAQFAHLSGRLQGKEGREIISFLMGDLYVGGRWQYFPVAFALKTPLPTLAFLLGAIVLSIRRPIGQYAWALWLPPLLFFGASLWSEMNLGYRYILPVLPFALVLAGRMGSWIAEGLASLHGQQRALLGATATAMIGWSAWSGLSIYPDYLAYFNELAGGPDNGWRYLVDANIDWGQDLKGLKRWMDAHGVERIKLGYYGEARPAYYGIDFEPLPSSPDRWQHPLYHDLYYADPAPGLYAISANLIQGRALADPETYAWFRAREPIDKVGYSIFIYDVPAHGEGSAAVGLSGLVPAEIRPEDYARLGTNDVRVLWYDVERALAFPAGEGRRYAFVADGAAAHPMLAGLWSPAASTSLRTQEGRPLALFTDPLRDLDARLARVAPDAPAWSLAASQFVPGDPAARGERLALPLQFGDPLLLLGYEVDRSSLQPGERLAVVTYWQVRARPAADVRLFVHLLGADGSFMGGEDRLDVWYEAWAPGDRFAQVQEVALDPGSAAGEAQIEIGWYDPQTMRRLSVVRNGAAIGDRALLRPISVE